MSNQDHTRDSNLGNHVGRTVLAGFPKKTAAGCQTIVVFRGQFDIHDVLRKKKHKTHPTRKTAIHGYTKEQQTHDTKHNKENEQQQ